MKQPTKKRAVSQNSAPKTQSQSEPEFITPAVVVKTMTCEEVLLTFDAGQLHADAQVAMEADDWDEFYAIHDTLAIVEKCQEEADL